MERQILETDLISEDGEPKVNNSIRIRMNPRSPDCPVTFVVDGKSVFSMGNEEVSDFIEALGALVI